jgi:BlaI family penicillinase repressor
MARPKAKELTERELEIMHIFWEASSEDVSGADSGSASELTAQQVRDALAKAGRSLAYTTVATLVRILHEKNFLDMTHDERPFRYQAARSFDDVSSSILHDLVDRVFSGSREALLVRLIDRRRLTAKERAALKKLLREEQR